MGIKGPMAMLLKKSLEGSAAAPTTPGQTDETVERVGSVTKDKIRPQVEAALEYPDLPFKKGDRACYPAQGLAEVEDIEMKNIAGTSILFYVLRILDTDCKIMVPVNNADAIGLRPVISEAQIQEVFAILREPTSPADPQAWGRRCRSFRDKIKTGSIYNVAEVLRDLYRGNQQPNQLSFSEHQMLDAARTLIVNEIAIARNLPNDTVRAEITAILAS